MENWNFFFLVSKKCKLQHSLITSENTCNFKMTNLTIFSFNENVWSFVGIETWWRWKHPRIILLKTETCLLSIKSQWYQLKVFNQQDEELFWVNLLTDYMNINNLNKLSISVETSQTLWSSITLSSCEQMNKNFPRENRKMVLFTTSNFLKKKKFKRNLEKS